MNTIVLFAVIFLLGSTIVCSAAPYDYCTTGIPLSNGKLFKLFPALVENLYYEDSMEEYFYLINLCTPSITYNICGNVSTICQIDAQYVAGFSIGSTDYEFSENNSTSVQLHFTNASEDSGCNGIPRNTKVTFTCSSLYTSIVVEPFSEYAICHYQTTIYVPSYFCDAENYEPTTVDHGNIIQVPYEGDMNVSWLISPSFNSSTHQIQLFVQFLILDSDEYDYLNIYNGPSAEYSLIETLTYYYLEYTIIAPGPSVYLEFHSDTDDNYDGFLINWSVVPKTASTGESTTTSGGSTTGGGFTTGGSTTGGGSTTAQVDYCSTGIPLSNGKLFKIFPSLVENLYFSGEYTFLVNLCTSNADVLCGNNSAICQVSLDSSINQNTNYYSIGSYEYNFTEINSTSVQLHFINGQWDSGCGDTPRNTKMTFICSSEYSVVSVGPVSEYSTCSYSNNIFVPLYFCDSENVAAPVVNYGNIILRPYKNNMKRKWLINPIFDTNTHYISIFVDFFRTEEDYDRLRLYKGLSTGSVLKFLTGHIYGEIINTTSSVYIEFSSNSANLDDGFILNWAVLPNASVSTTTTSTSATSITATTTSTAASETTSETTSTTSTTTSPTTTSATTSTTETAADNNNDEKGISSGALAAIIICSVLVAGVIIIGVAFLILRHMKNKRFETRHMSELEDEF